jgi:integrase
MKCHEKSNVRKPVIVKVGNAVVKIYQGKSRGYNLFTVVHYAGGQRKRETFAKLGEAKRRGAEVARAMLNGRLAVLELTNADRESYIKAMEQLKPLGIPLHAVVEEYIAARSHLDGESVLAAAKDYAKRKHNVVDKRVGEIVEELLAAKERDGLSLRYLQTLRSHLHRFAAAFQVNIGAVTAGMIEMWLEKLKVGPCARNNIRTSLVTLFQFACKHGYLPRDQRTEAEHVGRAKVRGGDIGILRPQELAKLLAEANAEATLYLALGAFTGLRSAELIRLEWEDINLKRGHIIVAKEKSKTASRRLVPILPNLSQWLAPYRGRTGRLFRNRCAAMRTIDFAKTHVNWLPNALRHSFASYRLAAVRDAARVALEMGNSPTMLFTNYRELADEHDAAAWFSIAPKPAKNVVQIAG